MDTREDVLRSFRDNDREFNEYFKECCKKYEQHPEIIIDNKKVNNDYRVIGGFFKRYSN